MERFCKLVDIATEKIGGAISLIALPIVFIIAAEVVLRYAFDSPTVWAWPVNRQLFAILSLFGGAYTLLHGRHIRVEVLYERFGPRLKLVTMVLTAITFFTFMGILVWQGYLMAELSFEGKESLTGVFTLPIYPLKILIPVAAFLFLLQGIAALSRGKL